MWLLVVSVAMPVHAKTAAQSICNKFFIRQSKAYTYIVCSVDRNLLPEPLVIKHVTYCSRNNNCFSMFVVSWCAQYQAVFSESTQGHIFFIQPCTFMYVGGNWKK